MDKLTNSQIEFCREYIYDWNATRSYKKAYPTVKNDNTAHVLASRLLQKVTIQSYIAEIQKDLEKLAGVSRLMVANEFRKLAFSDIAALQNTWIELKDFESLTDEQRSAIQEIDTKTVKQKDYEMSTPDKPVFKEVEYVKIKLHDKQRALENLNKMLGYNEPDKLKIDDNTEKAVHIVIDGASIDLSK
jgi:phage terminase small subunit